MIIKSLVKQHAEETAYLWLLRDATVGALRGWLKSLVGVVLYTEREGDVVRIISARKATKPEVQRYEQIIKD